MPFVATRRYDTVALGVILSIMNAALVGLAAFQVRSGQEVLILGESGNLPLP